MKIRLIIALLAASVIFGCGEHKGDTIFSDTISQQNGVLDSGNTLDKIYAQKRGGRNGKNILDRMTDFENGMIEFESGENILEKINVGDIIFGDISENIPYGFIEKVKSIKHVNGNVQFTTQSATIEDAFEYLYLHIPINAETIYDNMKNSKTGENGIVFKPTKDQLDIIFGPYNLPYSIMISPDFKQKVYITGTLILQPKLYFDCIYSKGSVTKIILSGTIIVKDNTKITGNSLLLKKNINQQIFITTIPISWVTVDIYAYAGQSGSITGNMAIGLDAGTKGTTIAISYPDGITCKTGSPYFNFNSFVFDSQFNSKIFCGAKLVASLAKMSFIANTTADVYIYNTLAAVVKPTKKYTVINGVNLTIGYLIPFKSASKTFELYKKSKFSNN